MRNKVVTYGLYTVIAGTILYFAFLKVFQNPEHYLFGDGGDGLKNYFTFVDYVRNGEGTHFSGMNYPYGEHVIFTDNQPAFAFFFNWINHNIISIDNNLIGIYNLILILAIFLSGLFVLKILKFFELPDWYSVTFAILIMFLSPQLLRLEAHFTLSYGFFIPAIWYYLLRIFDKSSRLIHYVFFGFIFLLSSFTHLYFLAINLMLVFTFSFITLLFFKKRVIVKLLKVIGVTVVLMSFTIAFIHLTDTVIDRPMKPWGIDFYNASFESIFLPNSGFLYKLLNVGNQKFEGLAYVGVVGLLFAVAFGLYIIYNMVKNISGVKSYFSSIDINKEKLLTISMITGVLTVLYSSHFYHNIDIFGITKHLGSFSQFRSIGRFAWIFYYVFTVFASYYIYRFFNYHMGKGRFNLAFLVLIFVVVVWSIEAQQNFSKSIEHIFNQNTYLINSDHTYRDILEKAGKTPNDFQAILQIPYVIIGPEKWGIHKGGWTIRQSYKCSFQTGLPIMDFMMSRSSLSQSLDLVQLLGSMPIERTRLQKMDKRPLLMIYDSNEVRDIEKHMLNKGILIGENKNIKLLEVPIDSLKSNIKRLSKRLYNQKSKTDSIYLEGNSGYYYIDNFEEQKAIVSFNGQGAKLFKDETIVCKQIPLDKQFYEISFWLYFDPLTVKKPIIYNEFSEGDNRGKTELSLDNIVDTKGYWIRLKTIVDAGMTHCIKIKGEAYIDAFMIRPVGSHLIEWKNDKVYYDNCELPKE